MQFIKSHLNTKYHIKLADSKEINNYLDIDLRGIIALKIWEDELKTKVSEGPLQYLNEIISNFNQITILGAMGFKIPSYMLMRRSIENLISFLYYKDHPIEFSKKEFDSESKRKFSSVREFREYLDEYPFYVQYKGYDQGKINILKNQLINSWMAQYSELSNYVHGTNSRYLELNDYLDEINPNDTLLASLGKSIQKFNSLLNTFFILFYYFNYKQLENSKKSIIKTAIDGNIEYKRELIEIFDEI
jgi:hypothetical protein